MDANNGEGSADPSFANVGDRSAASRRAVLLSLFSAVAGGLAACGGSDDSNESAASGPVPSPAPAPAPSPSPSPSPAPAPAPAPQAWNVGPLYFAAGSGATIDLAPTLPASVARGGTFGVSPSGAMLPSGMTLSAAGILALGNAQLGTVNGVLFTYQEP